MQGTMGPQIFIGGICVAALAGSAQAGFRLPATTVPPFPAAAVIEGAGSTSSPESTEIVITTDVLAPALGGSGDQAVIIGASNNEWPGGSVLPTGTGDSSGGAVFTAATGFAPAGSSSEPLSSSDLEFQWSGDVSGSDSAAPPGASGSGGFDIPNGDTGEGGPFSEPVTTTFGFGHHWLGNFGPGGMPELMPLPAPIALGLAGLVVVVVLRRRMLGK